MSECELEKRVRELEITMREVTVGLAGLRELTTDRFRASGEKVQIALHEQEKYNVLHNDLSRKNELMVKREEFVKDLDRVREDIRGLRESRSAIGGLGSAWPVIIAIAALLIAWFK